MIYDLRFKTGKTWPVLERTAAATAAIYFLLHCSQTFAFEGRISATLTRGGQVETLLYTAVTNQLRIEREETDRPYAKNIIGLSTGDITLVFPHNRSFVRLKPAAQNEAAARPGFPALAGMPAMAAMPRGAAPAMSSQPGHIGPTNVPGMPPMPAMPQMQPVPTGVAASLSNGMAAMPPMPGMAASGGLPPGVGPQSAGSGAFNALPAEAGMPGFSMPMMPVGMPGQEAELQTTTNTMTILGFPCVRYDLKQRGEIMEIWATDKLLPFQHYLQNQPHRFGPRMIAEQWGDLLKAKKLFPLLAILRMDRPSPPGAAPTPSDGPERLRFQVTAIAPGTVNDQTLFEPPPDYQEVRPLPF